MTGSLYKEDWDSTMTVPFISGIINYFLSKEMKKQNNLKVSGSMDLTEFFNPEFALNISGDDISIASSYDLFHGLGTASINITGRDTMYISGDFIPTPYNFTITNLGDDPIYEVPKLYTNRIISYDIHVPIKDGIKLETENISLLFDGDISIANSAALLGWQPEILTPKEYNNNGDFWIRPGISLYGISPFTDKTSASLGLQPVMKFEADLIDINSVSKGDSVGYGGTWTFSSNSNLGIISVGYGDGFSRYLPSGTPVLLYCRKVTLVGLISMDLAAVDLGLNSGDIIGDNVILLGSALRVLLKY